MTTLISDNKCRGIFYLPGNIVLAMEGGGGGGVLLGIHGGGVPPSSLNPDPISDQNHAIFHTRFQTWPLKSKPVYRPDISVYKGLNYVTIA